MYCSALRNNPTELSSQRKIDTCSMGEGRAAQTAAPVTSRQPGSEGRHLLRKARSYISTWMV